MEKRILLSSPEMLGREREYVSDAFDSNWIAPLGPFVTRFESDMVNYVNGNYALATSSGTSAIHLALKLCNVSDKDYVFCSDLTFSASANPIMYENCIPVFIDSDETYCMSPVALEKAFQKYLPKAVIVVDLYGNSPHYDKITSICNKYNVPIIEDAAEALGSTYQNKHLGLFGKYGTYSFNGNKIITTSGGGLLLTDNEIDRNKALFWATQAREKARHYEHKEVGYNYRLSNICAAIGVGQLEEIDKKIEKKTRIFNRYLEGLKDIKEIVMIKSIDECIPNHWLSCISLVNSKVTYLDILEELERNNVEGRPIWKPMHLQPVFKDYPFFSHIDEDNIKSVGENLFKNGLCLPSDPNMSDEEQDYVIKIIRNMFK